MDQTEMSSNGDLDESNPLSIDIDAEDSRPSIRINKGIQNQASIALKRKAVELNGTSGGPFVRKVRPSNTENEADINTLEKEIRALHWLARRKEQEWDQVIRLLKQKEEKLMQAQRTRTLIKADSEHILSRTLVLPKRNTILIANPGKTPQSQSSSVAAAAIQQLTSPLPPQLAAQNLQPLPQQLLALQPLPQAQTVAQQSVSTQPPITIVQQKPHSQPSSAAAAVTASAITVSVNSNNSSTTNSNSSSTTPVKISEDKINSALQKATENLEKEGGGKEKPGTPMCQGCSSKKSEFVCAGCSNRWYCSRECQVEDWDEHADDCSG